MLGVVLRFELLDKRGETAGEGHRGSVVLRLEAVPDCRQPSASTANRDCPILRSAIRPRLADNTRCRYVRERRRWRVPSRRLQLIGTKFGRAIAKWVLNHISTDPIVEAVGCVNRGLEAVLYRGGGGLGAVRAANWPDGCRHGDAPFELCFSHRSNRTAARLARVAPLFIPRRLPNARPLRRVPDICDQPSIFGSSPRSGAIGFYVRGSIVTRLTNFPELPRSAASSPLNSITSSARASNAGGMERLADMGRGEFSSTTGMLIAT
jgi:hypothetical protein